MEATQAKIPTLQATTDAKCLDPNVKFIPIDESWKQASCPPNCPFSSPMGRKCEQQPMSPIELAFQLETTIFTWDAAMKKKVEPSIDWVHAACVRSNAMNQEHGSQSKLTWRSFYFITDSSFKWASD